MDVAPNKEPRTLIGQIALHRTLGLDTPPPHSQSFVVAGARRTRETETYTEEYYPPSYATDGSLVGNLRFALKHESMDLRVVYSAMEAIGEFDLTAWVRAEPTSAFSRRAWFLYEALTGRTLDLEPVKVGNYVDALDDRRHYVATPINSTRQRIRDNLLGSRNLCPIVRRTSRLDTMVAAHLNEEARAMAANYSAETLARAVRYLYTKETRSSFAIEGETPGRNREERFLKALQSASSFDPTDKHALIRLQGSIVDARYAANDWRDLQNFVSESTRGFGEHVHFICPRPEDVPSLMEGWTALTERLLSSALDPVIAAAITAFAFVFIHPFEDGNGRIHRFLIHYMLAKRGFSPPGVIFPVSAAILRKQHLYDEILEAFSKPIMAAIEWSFLDDQSIQVFNETRDLYRFFDATIQAEYIYDRVAETIRVDFKEELEFLEVYDAAFAAVREIVDMPNRRAALLVRLCMQNGGRLSRAKSKQFEELTPAELDRIESAVTRIIENEGNRPSPTYGAED